jgi:hypothetical protein
MFIYVILFYVIISYTFISDVSPHKKLMLICDNAAYVAPPFKNLDFDQIDVRPQRSICGVDACDVERDVLQVRTQCWLVEKQSKL